MQLVQSLVEQLKSANEAAIKELVNRSYEHFLPSLKLLQSQLNSYEIPCLEEVYKAFENAIYEEHVDIRKINSDNDVLSLLDEKGQLKLDNPFNIFIGGQILDRGLTIENLIGFFYGRNPKKFQQDTVLQHSRMYGVRSKEDLAVTRLYTSGRIYNAMKTMYEFDTALREAFTKGAHKDGVVFIQKAKDGSIVPCAPNKILITSTTALNPHKELRLSAGFQTKAKTHIVKTIKEIDDILVQACKEKSNKEQPFRLSLAQALRICDLIDDTLEYGEKNNKGYEWVEKFKSVIEYLCKIADTEEVYCYVRRDRKISRTFGRKQTDEIYYSTFPDGGPDRQIAKEVAKKIPCLMLFKQEGTKEQGWNGAEFWWPVLMTPENTKTCIFASETQE